jgi:FixJ family two-component response regulator
MPGSGPAGLPWVETDTKVLWTFTGRVGHPERMTCSNGMEAKLGREEVLMVTRPLVSVVDDDESVRESLPDMLRDFGLEVQTFSSAQEFLASGYVDQTKCLILDVAMPGMSGPDLNRELRLRRQEIPIVFITALADETVRPRLLEQGAVECLFKPFSDTALLGAVNAALRDS